MAIPFSRGSSPPRDQTYVSYISCLDTGPNLKIVSLILGKNNSTPIVTNRNFSHEKQKFPMCTSYWRRVKFFHSQKYTLEDFLWQCLWYCVPFLKEKFLKQKTQTYKGENTDTLHINLCYGKCLQVTDWKNIFIVTDRRKVNMSNVKDPRNYKESIA